MNRMNKRLRNQTEYAQRNRMMSEDLTKKGIGNFSLTINNLSNDNDKEYIDRLSLQKSNSHKCLFMAESFSDKENLLSISESSPLENKISTKSDSIGLEIVNYSNNEIFSNQNLINYEEVMKLIVIGDKGVGKTLLVNRFVSDRNSDTIMDNGYIPTEWY